MGKSDEVADMSLEMCNDNGGQSYIYVLRNGGKKTVGRNGGKKLREEIVERNGGKKNGGKKWREETWV